MNCEEEETEQLHEKDKKFLDIREKYEKICTIRKSRIDNETE